MPQSRHLAVPTILLLLTAAAVPSSSRSHLHEVTEEEEFGYVHGEKNGPEHWGKIKEEWAVCGTGKMQSPIDISHHHVSLEHSLGYLNHSYRAAEACLVRRGHDMMVKFEGDDAGCLEINGTAYELHQLHWHCPSEHTIEGHRYDLELHMVHYSATNKTAVIGLLYEVGGSDEFLRKLEPFLKGIADKSKDKEERLGDVDVRAARGHSNSYYRYMGSLTTPPCTEGVIWTIATKVFSVSKDQLELLQDAVHDDMEKNARPLQELNNREISLFQPTPHKHHH